LRRAPSAQLPKWLSSKLLVPVAAGGAALALILGLVIWLTARPAGPAKGRVPVEGWHDAGAPRRLHSAGYGNCIFSGKELERGGADASLRNVFGVGEPIFGRCFFPHAVGPNKPNEIWQELWIDGVKRAQIIYDPALSPDEDQLGFDLSRRHASRLGELSSGKHTLDVWIYRQPDDADNPVPLAAGELVVRK
jgi:hypothetical protein